MRTLIRAAAWPTLSGVLYFLSWIGFGIWPLAFICFVPLVFSLREAKLSTALWLGTWKGPYRGYEDVWLRFYDGDGRCVPTAAEAAEAEVAQLKARLAELERR